MVDGTAFAFLSFSTTKNSQPPPASPDQQRVRDSPGGPQSCVITDSSNFHWQKYTSANVLQSLQAETQISRLILDVTGALRHFVRCGRRHVGIPSACLPLTLEPGGKHLLKGWRTCYLPRLSLIFSCSN